VMRLANRYILVVSLGGGLNCWSRERVLFSRSVCLGFGLNALLMAQST
jgi:hypothetical protein